MEGNFLNNNQNKKIEYIPVDDFDEGADIDTGELDDATGQRIVARYKDLSDAKEDFKISDDLKKEILNVKRGPIFIGDAFTTPEEREYLKRKATEEEKRKNEIDAKIKAERRRKGLCENCGGDPCRTDCDYR